MQDDQNRKVTFSWTHVVAFGAATALMIAIRFFGWPEWVWYPAILLFFGAEFHGAASGKSPRIDTFSQIMWAFYRGKPFRIPMLLGWIGWVVMILVEFTRDPIHVLGVPAPEFVLIVGFALWIIPHFLLQGKYG